MPSEISSASFVAFALDERRRRKRRIYRRHKTSAAVAAALLSALASVLSACGSGANSSSATTTVFRKPVIDQSGSGSKTFAPVNVPAKWRVTWKFNCSNPVTARRFVLTVAKTGASPSGITDQTGLGGGGTKTYLETGSLTFAVATTCGWNLLVGPPSSSSSTTTSSSTTSST
jgi:hypothetical protein